MKNIYIAAFVIALASPLAAQETYEIADVATQDLNGTARYVSMGGAMEALGADISTISSNPAGIGLFRKSQLVGTLGLVSQDGEDGWSSANKTNVSFDQIGFVYVSRTSPTSFLNFGFNYHKSRNFDQILSVTDRLSGASQSKLTFEKFRWGLIQSADDASYTQADMLYHEGLYDTNLLNEDGSFNTEAYPFSGDSYNYHRGNSGYIGEYDINLSGNINNRVYLGITMGIHDVNYRGHSLYNEQMQDNPYRLYEATLEDTRDIDGTGFDVKAGVIFRPVEESPFRLGLYINSPVFYSLKSSNTTSLLLNGERYGDHNPHAGSFEYEFRTPWKFGISAGHTVGNYLALGATLEYSDYSATDARIKGENGYDWFYDEYWSTSESDNDMNQHVKETLKGVATVKVGVEAKPDKDLAIRAGYNYVSPMYKEGGVRGFYQDGSPVWSDGTYFASTTDYTNWKATHRLTLGLGFNLGMNWKLDAAYQYSMQKGEFVPFTGSDDNLPYAINVSNNRHQVMMTLGYSF
ncbi:MAG: hemin receptor [Prevotella sp.]|nr:hemin receptor [Prevotella sp.]